MVEIAFWLRGDVIPFQENATSHIGRGAMLAGEGNFVFGLNPKNHGEKAEKVFILLLIIVLEDLMSGNKLCHHGL